MVARYNIRPQFYLHDLADGKATFNAPNSSNAVNIISSPGTEIVRDKRLFLETVSLNLTIYKARRYMYIYLLPFY